MHSQEGDVPTAAITQAMNEHLGGFDAFKTTFTQAALTPFGSGWAWLSMTADKKIVWKVQPIKIHYSCMVIHRF